MMSSKLTITIDIGQKTKSFQKIQMLSFESENENRIVFNSIIDALNFMSSHGYEFVTANIIKVDRQNVYHYLMRK